MKKAFSHAFPAPAWRLLFEQAGDAPGRLLVEWRDGTARRLGITLVALPDGALLSDPQAELPWNSAVLGVWNGLALYHRLGNEQLPVPSALGCFDPTQGQTRWEWPDHLLLACDGRQVEARQTAPYEQHPASVYFDLQSGRPLPSGSTLPPNPDLRASYPSLYLPNSQYWPLLTRFVKKITGQTPQERLHYAENGDKILISYYVYTESGALEAFLLVSDRNERIWLHQVLQSPDVPVAHGTDLTAFCVWQNLLLTLTTPIELTGFFID